MLVKGFSYSLNAPLHLPTASAASGRWKRLLGHIVIMSAALKESAEERRRSIRDADDLVRCLTIEFEIELGHGLAIIPIGETLDLAPP